MSSTTDLIASHRYFEALATAPGLDVLDHEAAFVCRHGETCKSSAQARGMGFASGQLSYVGDHYACTDSGKPLRILVVSMQVGDAAAPVTMERRAEQIKVRIPQTPGQRNPHMRGVTRALQLLHGLNLDVERLADGTHVLEAYSMVNSVLCSALPTDGKSRRGKPTERMLSNCSAHLRESIEVLEPTIIHTQGADTRLAVEQICRTVTRHSNEVSTVEVGGRSMVLCAGSHPAAGPPLSWSSIKPGGYFAETIVPALELARSLALR